MTRILIINFSIINFRKVIIVPHFMGRAACSELPTVPILMISVQLTVKFITIDPLAMLVN